MTVLASSNGNSDGQRATSSRASATTSSPSAALETAEEGNDALSAALAACEDGGNTSGAASTKATVPRPQDDPALALPVPSRPDWEAEMKVLNQTIEDPSVSDEDTVRILHDALVQRIEDTRAQDESTTGAIRRLDEAAKERERARAENQRTLAVKAKLESSCRDLQQQKSAIAAENQRIREEEQSRHTELKEKFQQAIKDVQEKMDAELEVRQHFLRENEDLRGKLAKFTETYEAQERQVAEQREAREKEMEVAQQRLKEHETMCGDSKVKTAALTKQNEVLRKSTAVLRDELQTILGKFDGIHEAVTGSNQRHGDCKTEIDTLQARLQDLEKENGELRNNSQLTQLTEEQNRASKQRDALERLCENLQKENRTLREQLEGLRRGKSGKK
mmetsp:Transcript_103144/g.204893  ORF Transcript_103144/g.204893 Transcript_103144/m.204893 type:complete len:391 (+) Transcript_103144:79-1251(+)|eukprot:CAMPEP_0172715908 /NCGR_PEP_ID=MMETSP1074-20121228/67813_1 /TAXON_ID=2916 /ORGANISM="Ceratium fusus, Strain PA161109" /LENGTH=390 /DNA_ID=CAMNT_0013540533 /DNA_START=74 /DNA_END=1246 /DNA_ORIENTATION=+